MTLDSLELQAAMDRLALVLDGEGRKTEANLVRQCRSWGRANEEKLERIKRLAG